MKKVLNWIVISFLALVVAGLGFIYLADGYGLYLVKSGSMEPAIMTGDMIITAPIDNPVRSGVEAGTVITFHHNGNLVTHRVKSINGTSIVTQGDAVEDVDPWPVTMSDIEGVYLFKIPSIGHLLNFIHTKLGWFLMIIVPGALLVLWITKDIVKEAFSEA